MVALSGSQETELRSDSVFKPQQRLYPFSGEAIWRGQVQNSPARGDQTLTVNGAFETGFSLADVHRHCLVTFGTVVDADDVTRRVVLTFNGTDTLIIDNHDRTIPQFSTFTIWNFYPIWPKLAYALYDEAAGTTDFYQDGKPPSLGGDGISFDIDEWLSPDIKLGFAHLVRFIPSSDFPLIVNFTPSVVLTNSNASSYTLAVTASPPSLCSIVEIVPGSYRLTFSAYGNGYIHVKATDNVAGVTTAHRPVVIQGNTEDVGITEFEMQRPTEQINQINATTQIAITAPDIVFSAEGAIDWRDLRPDTLMLATQDDYFDDGQFFISSQSLIDENVILSGYIKSSVENHIRDKEGNEVSSVELTVENIPSRFTYALSQTGKAAVTSFLEMRADRMGVAWLISAILKGYSTFANLAEMSLPYGDAARRAGNELVTAGDIFQGIKKIADARVMDTTFSFTHRLDVQYNLNFQDLTTRNAATTTFTLTKADLGELVRCFVSHRPKIARIALYGGSSGGNIDATDAFDPFIVTSSRVPEANADPVQPDIQRKMFIDINDALFLVARMDEVANQRYYQVVLENVPDRYHRVFKINDNQWINLGDVASPTDPANIRGDASDLVNRRCMLRAISHNGDGTITVTLEPEAPVTGITGVVQPAPALPTQTALDGNTPTFPSPFDFTPGSVLGGTGSPFIVDPLSGFFVSTNGGGLWVQRNTGLPSTAARYAIIDPYDHVSGDIDSTSFYICGVGFVGYSSNGGQNWTDLTSLIPDPPDTYSSATPPTAETVTYTFISGNPYSEGELLISVEWYDVDTWRSYILKRSAALAWSWEDGLATVLTVPTNWWETVGSTETAGSLLTWPEDKITQAVAVTDTGTALQANANGFASNPTVAHLDLSSIGFPDDTVLSPATPLAVSFRVTFDFYKASASTDYLRLEQGGSSNIRAQYNFLDAGHSIGTWQSYDITFGGNIFTRYPDHPDGLLSSRNSLYLVFRLEKSGNQVRNFKWELLTSISGGGGQSRQLGQDIDRHGGTNLYKVEWDGSDIVLLKRLVSDLSITTQTTLGAATLTQIDDRDYYARVYCPPASFGNSSYVYIYGLWNDGSNNRHLMLSTDGGATLSDIGDTATWGASHWVSEFFAIDANTMYAFVAGTSRALYRTQDGINWDNLGSLPFDVERASLGGDGRIIIASRTASGAQAATSEGPLYSSWVDVSGSLPTNSKEAVVWV